MTSQQAQRPFRTLVTGAGGFIGTNLCRAAIARGYETHGTLRPGGSRWRVAGVPREVVLHEVNLRDMDATRKLMAHTRPQIVFHAAVHDAYAATESLGEIVADNLGAMANVLDTAFQSGCHRIVLLGSSLEYARSLKPHGEDDPLQPDSLRGATKVAATLIARQWAQDNQTQLSVLRPFSVYGPWEAPQRLIPTAIRAALRGEELLLTKPGLRRDLVFVEDVAEACLQAAVNGPMDGRAINIGSGRQISNEEIVACVGKILGRSIRIRSGAFPSRPTDRHHWVADISRARDLLGWEPQHSLTAGLSKTIEWQKKFENHHLSPLENRA